MSVKSEILFLKRIENSIILFQDWQNFLSLVWNSSPKNLENIRDNYICLMYSP